MPIQPEQAATIAKLARLRLDDATLGHFAGQMDNILAYMETLSAVDTTGVEPLSTARWNTPRSPGPTSLSPPAPGTTS